VKVFEVNDHAIITYGIGQSSLVHVIARSEHDLGDGSALTICALPARMTNLYSSHKDLFTNNPITCLWCIAQRPHPDTEY
jgi:hypothetical protein